MGQLHMETCDRCGKFGRASYNKRDLRLEPLKGACVEIGYSDTRTGWGLRRNHVNGSGVLCPDCYEAFTILAKSFAQWWRNDVKLLEGE